MSVDFYKEFGELGYLASYSDHGFEVNGIYYPTVEHYYQASKFDDEKIINKILNCKTPKEASMIGRDRNNIRIPNFKEVKIQKMYEANLEKFRQNPELAKKLLDTGNEAIREMTTKESFWGVGPNLDGENHMGKILMRVREELRKEVK
ncbi:MAG: NADAR family protein [Bacilli bacterium]|nr:NADAR family protein [Bacilli bacterium]